MSIIRTDTRPLGNRLKSALATKYGMGIGTLPDTSALLLDISYSMDQRLTSGKRRIDELRVLAAEFRDVRRFEFSTTCAEIPHGEEVSDVAGGTALDVAFWKVKERGVTHVVLITDGEPDNEDRAILAAAGLKVDAFYVGPDNDVARKFLERLCQHSGGTYGAASLDRVRELTASVKARLQLTSGTGAIAL